MSQKAKTFYVSTPIYYPSGKLHIGHTYTTTMADILTRYKKLRGFDTFLLTGSDEHGQKIEKKAAEEGMDPKTYVDNIVSSFKNLWKQLDIDYTKFIRTTDAEHVSSVKGIFTTLLNKGLIYKGQYQGQYCISCEEFLTSSQIDENGMCIVSNTKPELVKEDTYFLKISLFKDFLTKLLKSNFLIPEARRNEMLKNFVELGLEDLSVTRISFNWGIPINEDPKHIIYVWIDALSNYITALGYGSKDDSLMKKYWSDSTEIVQYVGKEITRFHSIYWPVILESLGLRLPNRLISHGWILSQNTKMSKSIGNVVDPIELIKIYGSDTLRFYIANELPIVRDGNYSDELIIESYNTHLANNFGNLASRVSNMIIKYFDGNIGNTVNEKNPLIKYANDKIEKYWAQMDLYDITSATEVALSLGQHCNKLIEEAKPWDLAKDGKTAELSELLSSIRYCIMAMAIMLKPILVKSTNQFTTQFGCKESDLQYGKLAKIKYSAIKDKLIIFKRIINDEL